MVVAAFSVTSQADRVNFFEKTFLVAKVSLDMVIGMPFFTLSGADVNFPKKELWWRSYTIKEALSTTKQVELVRKKKFTAAALNLRHETFVVHKAFLENSSQKDYIHPFCRVQKATLVANKAPTSIPTEYSDFANVFSLELALKLFEYTKINDHAIKLVDDWQLLYGPIYSLRPIELKILKTYIKTNLANSFIRPSKSPTGTPILFDKKPDGSL